MPTATKLRIPSSAQELSTADGGAADPDNARPDADASAGEAGEATTSSARQATKKNIWTWTADEHRLFLEGLERHGKSWPEVAAHVGTRTVVQIRSHAHQYFKRLANGSLAQWTFAEVAMQKDANPPSGEVRRSSGRKPKPIANFFASVQKYEWTAEEDERLTELVGGYPYGSGEVKWKEIATKMPGRDNAMCEKRWRIHLDTSYNLSPFTADEDRAIVRFQADEEKAGNWDELAEDLPGGRTANQIKQRWFKVLCHGRREKKGGKAGGKITHQLVPHKKEQGVQRRQEEDDAVAGTSKKTSNRFTAEEDEKLRELVKGCGSGKVKWKILAAEMPGRSGKQIRSRWLDHLDPSISHSSFTAKEDGIIARFQADEETAGKWTEIAKRLPGRTAHQIKNRWNWNTKLNGTYKKTKRSKAAASTPPAKKRKPSPPPPEKQPSAKRGETTPSSRKRKTAQPSSEDIAARARRLADASARKRKRIAELTTESIAAKAMRLAEQGARLRVPRRRSPRTPKRRKVEGGTDPGDGGGKEPAKKAADSRSDGGGGRAERPARPVAADEPPPVAAREIATQTPAPDGRTFRDVSVQFPEPHSFPHQLCVRTSLVASGGLGISTDLTSERLVRSVGFSEGIVHAVVDEPGGRERHAFVWVDTGPRLVAAVSQLISRGHEKDSIEFIPYSSKANWLARHPSSIEVTRGEGGLQPLMPRESYDRARRLFHDSILTDTERDELHLEIYLYCSWLGDRLREIDALREAAMSSGESLEAEGGDGGHVEVGGDDGGGGREGGTGEEEEAEGEEEEEEEPLDGRGFTVKSLKKIMWRMSNAFRSVKEHARDRQMEEAAAQAREEAGSSAEQAVAEAGSSTAQPSAALPAVGSPDAAEQNPNGAPLLERRAASLSSSSLKLRPSFDGALLSNDERDALHVEIFGYLVHILREVRKVESVNAQAGCNRSKKVSRAGIGPTNLERATALVGSVLGLPVPNMPVQDSDNTDNTASSVVVRPHLIETLLERDVRHAVERRNAADEVASREDPWGLANPLGLAAGFEASLALLATYRRVSGTVILPGKKHRNAACRKLARFAAAVRGMRRENKLTDDHISRLDELGFDWMDGARNTPAKTFEESLEDLRKFVAENGHCRPTPKKSGDKALCDFVAKCRKSWKNRNAHFMATRFKPLDDLGFQWKIVAKVIPPTKPKSFDKTFDDCFARLEAFRTRHGHTRVSAKTHGGDTNLFNFVRHLRANMAAINSRAAGEDERPSPARRRKLVRADPEKLLTPGRIERLDAIGFEWETGYVKSTKTWEDYFNDLLDYFSSHGTFDVPRLLRMEHETKGTSTLGHWVYRQREMYRKEAEGAKIPSPNLWDERRERLNGIGFNWAKGQSLGSMEYQKRRGEK